MTSSSASTKLASPKLLEKIDQLFELNIGEHVDLPQLVVVGDQSSGKSSGLEGLTGLAFPRNMGLCTRFATQITFRRDPIQSTRVSIIPAADADPAHAEKLRAWKADEFEALDTGTFEKILNEVHNIMGVGKPDQDGVAVNKTFSEDVLRIEIRGPKEQHLSVIDVPGIFKKVTQGLTTRNDMAMVRKMVTSYMMNPRSIILAVVPANVDVATQEILDMAEECDPSGQRTLGVLTKPDLVDRGAEQSVVDIVEGRSHALNLGWCIIRNPGQQELNDSSIDRSIQEKTFFKTREPWTRLPRDRVGTEALRTRLVDILGEMVYREFSKVKTEINQKLKTAKTQLNLLGPSRDTKEQQHEFLLDLATRFQTIASHALMAHYGNDDIFDKMESLKLATKVVNRNAAFSEAIWKRGHTMHFEGSTSGASGDFDSEKSEVEGNPEGDEGNPEGDEGNPEGDEGSLEHDEGDEYYAEVDTEPTNTNRLHKRKYEEVEDLLEDETKLFEEGNGSIMKWLEQMYTSSRGYELGSFDSSLLGTAWRKQSANWDSITIGYINDIVSLVYSFINDLMSTICEDERVRRALNAVLRDHLTEKYKKSIEHTKFILRVERLGTPLTTNHYFSDNLEKSRQARLRSRLEREAYIDARGQKVINFDATVRTSRASNLDHTVSEIHDILKSYYKVARKRFVDVVCMQACDNFLVNGPDTPVKVFSPKFVYKLSDDQLEAIAGEKASKRSQRMQLKRLIASLERGKKVLL